MEYSFIHFPSDTWNLEFYVFYTFCFFVVVQLLYIFLVYSRLTFYKPPIKQQKLSPPISVIIVAHNQADFLRANLPTLLQQNYPTFEVIVVSHQSSDETSYVLFDYQQKYNNLKYTIIEPSPHLNMDKTLPLNLAMKKVSYEHILLTEADCCPDSLNYLQEISNSYSKEKSVVLAYALPQQTKGFLNQFIHMDTAWHAFNYLSFALSKIPYLGQARNIFCTKDVLVQFLNKQNTHTNFHQYSDTFVGQLTEGKKYAIVISKESRMYFAVPKVFKNWIHERNELFSVIANLSFFKKILVGMYPLSLLFMYVSFILLLFFQDTILISFVIFACVLCLKWILQGISFFKLDENKMGLLFPLYDVLCSMIMPVIYYACDTKRRNK